VADKVAGARVAAGVKGDVRSTRSDVT
jgi:hypothetical protein